MGQVELALRVKALIKTEVSICTCVVLSVAKVRADGYQERCSSL